MSEPTLKPCPRCGGKAKILEDYDAPAGSSNTYVKCQWCGLISPNHSTPQEASAWWNERPAEQAKEQPTWTCRRCDFTFHGEMPTGWNGYCSACQPVVEGQLEPGPSAKYDCCVWVCKVCGKRQTTKAKESLGETCKECKAKQATPQAFDNFLGKPIDLPELKFAGQPGQAEPTRNAAEPAHQCPYGGEHWTESAWVRRRQLCGEQGWLCDRCKLDRLGRYFTSVNMRLAAIAQSISPPSTVPQKESEQ